MTDAPFAPFVPGNFAGPGITGEHLAAIEMEHRARRMDAWAGQAAAGLASAYYTRHAASATPEAVAEAAWAIAQHLEVQREKVLTDFAKKEDE